MYVCDGCCVKLSTEVYDPVRGEVPSVVVRSKAFVVVVRIHSEIPTRVVLLPSETSETRQYVGNIHND